MNALLFLIVKLIDIYIWVIIIQVIMGWLVAYNVVNSRSPFVHMVGNFLHKATDPLLRRIRRYVPDMGGIDVSAILAILALSFVQWLIVMDIAPALT
jgi:YggT family protein